MHGEDHIINSIFIWTPFKINFHFACLLIYSLLHPQEEFICLLLCLLFGEQGTKQEQWAREEDGERRILSSISLVHESLVQGNSVLAAGLFE